MLPVHHHRAPSTTTSVTSAAAAAKTTFSAVAPPPAVRTESRSTATRSARAPTRALRRPSSRGRGDLVGGRLEQAVGGDDAALREARRSSSSTARASSNRSITAWLSEPRLKRPRPSSSAGRVRSRRRDHVRWWGRSTLRSPSGQVGDVLVGQVGGVHRRGPGPKTPLSRRTAVGVRPWTAQALLDLAGLLRRVDVQRSTMRGSPLHHGSHFDGGTARTECIAAPTISRLRHRPRLAMPRRARPSRWPCRRRTAVAVPGQRRAIEAGLR